MIRLLFRFSHTFQALTIILTFYRPRRAGKSTLLVALCQMMAGSYAPPGAKAPTAPKGRKPAAAAAAKDTPCDSSPSSHADGSSNGEPGAAAPAGVAAAGKGSMRKAVAAAATVADAAAASKGLRVLVAAHTNVAVDRVLSGLADAGFTDMIRIGSLPRIAKRVLKYALHASEGSRNATDELKDMLAAAGSEEDAAIIR